MRYFKTPKFLSRLFFAWGIAFVILILALGFRLSHLDKKFYWIDEVSSSYVVTGHWPEYVENELGKLSGQVITVGKLQDILEQTPNSDSTQLISSLLNRDPQHSPLYFLIVQKWATIFGAKPESLRMASSILSFIGVVAFAWLCIELFGSILFGIIGLSCIAFAPFHILFSQQNREYGLWFTVCTLSTALLLLANRKNNKTYWAAYGLSVAVTLYTFLFSLPFLCSHFLFQWFERQSDSSSKFKNFLWSFLLGIFAYTPWALNIMMNVKQVLSLNSWSAAYLEPALYLQSLILNFSRLFLDVNLPSFKPLPWDQPLLLVSIFAIFSIVIISLTIVAKSPSFPKRILILSMFAIPFLFLISMDIFAGKGIHALVGRQLMPAWLAVYLAVSYTICMGTRSNHFLKKGLAFGAVTVLLVSQIIFVMKYPQERHWWPLKPESVFNDALDIEQENPSLIIISEETQIKQFLSLSYTLSSNFPLLSLKDNQQIPEIKKESKFAVYQPSEWLIEKLKENWVLQKKSNDVWIGQAKADD